MILGMMKAVKILFWFCVVIAVFCAGERFYMATQFIARENDPQTKISAGVPLKIGSRTVTVNPEDVQRFEIQQMAFNGALIVGLCLLVVLISKKLLARKSSVR
jgi:hypothetical protein